MKFFESLVLMYINSAKDLFTYKDLTEILSMPYEQIEILLDRLCKLDYLEKSENKYLILSEKGINFLSQSNFTNIDIYNLHRTPTNLDTHDYLDKRINLNDIYIPEKFDEKFNGYK